MTLRSDRDQLALFLDALFRYVDVDTYVAWRAFRDDAKDKPPVLIEWSQVAGGEPLPALLDAAQRWADVAAQHPSPAVFCPPIATFTTQRARELDLANGLALSVECDANPDAARAALERILGPATVVVASGGVTSSNEDKLHLHWRLSEPTATVEDHARLKRARILATAIVGGDATNVPAVHPIRWPGSWHRKHEPRLATIVAIDADRELHLTTALEHLEDAAVSIPRPVRAGDVTVHQNGADGGETSALITLLLSGEAIHAPLVSLAYRYLKAGMADAQCVLTLRGLMDAIPVAARGGDERWNGHFRDVPRTVRTAREKLSLEGHPSPQLVDVSPLVNQAPAIVVARAPEVKEIPGELLQPPGILGDITRYGIETSVRPVPIFAVQAALALGSTVCARRYVTDQENYSSLYFLNIAKSGSGKEHAKTTIENVLLAAGAERLIGSSSYSSGSAVFSALLSKPQHLTIIDEFGKYLEAASNQRENWKTDVLTQLMEAFGRVHGRMLTPQFSTMTVSPTAATNMKPKAIVRPAITLLAMTTPSTFYDTMRSTRVQDGFLNRFLIAEHQGPRVPRGDRKTADVPLSAVAWVRQLLEPAGNLDSTILIDVAPDATVVPLTGVALARSKCFERDMLDLSARLEGESLGDMPIRAAEIALRLALIVAMADAPDTPVVTDDCLDWAVRYVRFFLEQTIAAIRERVADTTTERTRNTVLAAIRAAGAQGLTNREINRAKTLIGLPKRDRIDAMESLLAAELIGRVTIATGGRPREALVAIGEVEAGTDAGETSTTHLELAS
jgi:hypothetical protein